ncbi:MAG TPA: PilZ domain-containing protein [Dokdonella sp.]
MIEKRRHPRKRPEVVLQVTDAMSAEPIGRLGNLSAHGMMLIAHGAIADDALYQFTFSLPDAHGRLHPLEVGVHELWSEPARLAGHVWVGFRFIDIGADDASVLRGWLENRAAAAAGGFRT